MMVGFFAFSIGVSIISDTVSAAPLVISQLQTADTSLASNEAVEIYNNTTVDQNVTNWCIRYSSATSSVLATSPSYCFTPPDAQTHIFLAANSFATIATSTVVLPGFLSPDGRFSGSGIAAGGGHIKLLNGTANTVDSLGWGTAIYGEGFVPLTNLAPTAPSSAQALHRKNVSNTLLQDTDNNKVDFETRSPSFRAGGVYEIRYAVDVCGNISDIQEIIPEGYGFDEAGNCELLASDKCINIAAIQLTIPPHLMSDEMGGCFEDLCSNLFGLQQSLPHGHSAEGTVCYELEKKAIFITEVMPNAAGIDSGKEFIELFNPHGEDILLDGYKLLMGKNLEIEIVLGGGHLIHGRSYTAFYDEDLKFTLLNTNNQLQLIAPAGNIVSSVSYGAPADDMAWADIRGAWQYTNQLTPGAENVASLILEESLDEVASVSLGTCPSGKYRHPITNRCRNIEVDTTILVACDADEYRNPETNRCRKIGALASILAACTEGSERNPETNRCRKVAGVTSNLAPCQSGYTRNLETNRCRKDLADSVSAIEPVLNKPSPSSTLEQTLMLTAGFGALGYGVYEWRGELFRVARRTLQLVSGK